jgi:phage host-nuclease inhibitor protein Gam
MSEEKSEYEVETEQKAPFTIDSEEKADYALREIYLLRSEIALLEAQHKERTVRLNSELTQTEGYFLPQLEHWSAQQIAGEKRKSLILPHGTVQFRTVKAGVKVVDKEAAIAWAQSACMDDAVKIVTTTTLDTEEYKRIALHRLTTLGEVVPGILTTEAHESFSVRFGKE